MKSTEVGHSIKNEIEHNRKYQSASHIYWVQLISSINGCVCVVISNVFLTASCGQTILEAIVQVYFPGSILFSEFPYRPLQINLTKALLLAFHFPAQKPSIFKNLGSISTPQRSTEKGLTMWPHLERRLESTKPLPKNWPPDCLPQILLMHCLHTPFSSYSSHSPLKQYTLGRSRFSYNPILYSKSLLTMPHGHLASHFHPCEPLTLSTHWPKTGIDFYKLLNVPQHLAQALVL